MSKEYNNKKILNEIYDATSKVEIPDSVKPENMMQYVASKKEEGYFERINNLEVNKQKKRKNKIIKLTAGIGAVAAAIIVAVIGMSKIPVNGGNNNLRELHMSLSSQDTEGVYVLSSYKDLASYRVAMASKYKKQTFGDMLNGFASSIDDMLTLGNGMASDTKGENMSNMDQVFGNQYSDTNSRTEGVGEADIVKTDGEYIYYISRTYEENTVTIVKADGENTKNVATFAIDSLVEEMLPKGQECGFIEARDLLIYGDTLIILVRYGLEEHNPNTKHYSCTSYTAVLVYDVTQPDSPKNIAALYTEGEYTSCKYVDGYVYVFSEMYKEPEVKNKSYTENQAKEMLAPMVNGQYMEASNIYVAQANDYVFYNIMVSLDLNNPTIFKDAKAILGDSGNINVYVSTENIYIISNLYNEFITYIGENDYEGKVTTTNKAEIVKVSYKDGMFNTTGRTEIAGELGDEFDIDEYNGYLRMAVSKSENNINYDKEKYIYYDGDKWVETTEIVTRSARNFKRSSVMYVLNDNLELVGELTLQEEEEVYGVRFDGDVAYVVTYRQTDPLFTVDLSEPTCPKVMGALKIPGFSEYLHVWNENTLLGLGYDAYGDVKISTYDISDKYDVKEMYVESIKDVDDSAALHDHRAAFISTEKNLLGFATEGFVLEGDYYVNRRQYRVYQYVDGEFDLVLMYMVKQSVNYEDIRGLYIGEYLYIVVPGDGVHAFELSDFSNVAVAR